MFSHITAPQRLQKTITSSASRSTLGVHPVQRLYGEPGTISTMAAAAAALLLSSTMVVDELAAAAGALLLSSTMVVDELAEAAASARRHA